jgi:hypothetical protein
MADDEDLLDLLRIREVLGIGTPRVFPLGPIGKRKKRPSREEEESWEKTKEKKPPKSGEGVDIEV